MSLFSSGSGPADRQATDPHLQISRQEVDQQHAQTEEESYAAEQRADRVPLAVWRALGDAVVGDCACDQQEDPADKRLHPDVAPEPLPHDGAFH